MIDTIDTIDTAEFKTASKVVSMVALGIDTIDTGHRHQVLVVHHDRATGAGPGAGPLLSRPRANPATTDQVKTSH